MLCNPLSACIQRHPCCSSLPCCPPALQAQAAPTDAAATGGAPAAAAAPPAPPSPAPSSHLVMVQCKASLALSMLLLLKEFVKGAYSVNSERIVAFATGQPSASTVGSSGVPAVGQWGRRAGRQQRAHRGLCRMLKGGAMGVVGQPVGWSRAACAKLPALLLSCVCLAPLLS